MQISFLAEQFRDLVESVSRDSHFFSQCTQFHVPGKLMWVACWTVTTTPLHQFLLNQYLSIIADSAVNLQTPHAPMSWLRTLWKVSTRVKKLVGSDLAGNQYFEQLVEGGKAKEILLCMVVQVVDVCVQAVLVYVLCLCLSSRETQKKCEDEGNLFCI